MTGNLLAGAILLSAGCSSEPSPQLDEATRSAGSETPGPLPSEGDVGIESEGEIPEPVQLAWGEEATIVGRDAGGQLRVTPATVIYHDGTESNPPAQGAFASVIYRVQNPGDAAETIPAPIDGGGWSFVTSAGRAVSILQGNATNMTLSSFLGGGEVPAQSFREESVSFDIPADEIGPGARLILTDAFGATTTWDVPGEATGPHLDQARSDLTEFGGSGGL